MDSGTPAKAALYSSTLGYSVVPHRDPDVVGLAMTMDNGTAVEILILPNIRRDITSPMA